MPDPRPVTPVGIAAQLLDLDDRLAAIAGVPDDVRADVRRAHRIVAGLEAYVERCTTPAGADLARLAEQTAAVTWSDHRAADGPHLEQEMLSGHVEGAFLRMLVRMTGARQVLEIGMFTGYSALAMAEALPAGGQVVACEVDAFVAGLATRSFAEAEAGSRVDVRVGPALDTLGVLREEGRCFDLVFLDADKPGYVDYLRVLLDTDLLAPDGVFVVDNTLLQGEPWAADDEPSANGRAVADFNAVLADDPRVEQVLVPLRDGVTLARRV